MTIDQQTFKEIEQLLSECDRSELSDHAFSDREIYWTRKDSEEMVAEGYAGRSYSLWVNLNGKNINLEGDECKNLLNLGTFKCAVRNDSGGSDIDIDDCEPYSCDYETDYDYNDYEYD